MEYLYSMSDSFGLWRQFYVEGRIIFRIKKGRMWHAFYHDLNKDLLKMKESIKLLHLLMKPSFFIYFERG